jgi:hypothetical protein
MHALGSGLDSVVPSQRTRTTTIKALVRNCLVLICVSAACQTVRGDDDILAQLKSLEDQNAQLMPLLQQ